MWRKQIFNSKNLCYTNEIILINSFDVLYLIFLFIKIVFEVFKKILELEMNHFFKFQRLKNHSKRIFSKYIVMMIDFHEKENKTILK